MPKELVVLKGKPLPDNITALAITTDGTTILALTTEDLFVIDPMSLSPTRTITIKMKDGRHLSSYWSADNVVISPDQEHALVLESDQLISLKLLQY